MDASATSGTPVGVGRRGRLAALALVVLAAFLPAVGTLRAPWIAEDSAILGYATQPGWSADWAGPQYGMLLLRFWRPVVTTSWACQAALFGAEDPGWLRSLNLLLHATSVVVLVLLLRRLGVSDWGAWLGGLCLATFPEQGGTVTWIAGRTDLLGGLGMLVTLLVAFTRGWIWSAPLAFLACGAKEFAFLLPAWVGLLAWGSGLDRRQGLRRTLPVLVGCLAAFLVRRWSLGTWGGGYPAVLPGPLDGLLGSVRAYTAAVHPALLLVPLLVLGAALAGAVLGRLCLAASLTLLLGLAPLYPLLADGHIEPQNTRLFFVSELGLALLVGAALGRPPQTRQGVALALLGAILIVWRGQGAYADAAEWKAAAEVAGEHELRARDILAGSPEAATPVLVAGFPRSHGGSYCLGFGVAERFRAPFAATPRPVWPLRTISGFPANERRSGWRVRDDGSLWIGGAEREPGVAAFAMGLEGGTLDEPLVVDERVLGADPKAGPILTAEGRFADASFEVLVYTERGYEPVPLGPAGASEGHRLPLKAVLRASNGVYSVGTALQAAADLGATCAFLELRAIAADGHVLAVAPWIELVWSEDFLAKTL